MLFELLFTAEGARFDVPGAGLLRYISVRAAAAAFTAFALALVFGPRIIARLAGEDTGKTASAVLRELHAAKRGTPTMGGLFLVGAMLVSSLLWARFDAFNDYTAIGLGLVAWFAAVGFADDWIKLRQPGRTGLSARVKQLWLTAGAVLAAIGLLVVGLGGAGGPAFYVPFMTEPLLSLGVAFGLPFVVVAIVVLTGSANAVNLTDGLDGLAIGCVIAASLAYAGICYFVGHREFADYLLVAHVPGAGEITVVLGALLGAAFGFLWFNAPPAQVFMGDVGSLPLGGALGFAALVSRTELVLFVVGGVFVVEVLSVVIQVASCKLRGKRVFRCAPLHHHFQFAGMPETRIVVRAWLVAAILAMTSLVLFKVR